jgi:hypothetical protein
LRSLVVSSLDHFAQTGLGLVNLPRCHEMLFCPE